jgi:serine/threonine-protein kinase HipA
MSDPAAHVYLEIDGVVRSVGRLWVSSTRDAQHAAFEFDDSWVADPIHYALGPALPAGPGQFHTAEGRTMFGALGDSAPDRWGRKLIARSEARRARDKSSTPRTLREIDFLLGVSDVVRQGAIRFAAVEGGPFIAELDGSAIPPLVELGALLAAADALDDDADSVVTDDAVRLLLAPGSSLGGARAKASVRDHDGTLSIAKFPEKGDDVDAVRWEALMLTLAERAGIGVPDARIEKVGDRVVLLEKRFDRRGSTRVPFLSAMSLLNAKDGERRSYVEIADALRQISATASADGPQLWRRMAFNILASNFDDHLRNHAIIFQGAGWTLSPAFDLNPVPRHVKPRDLTTSINIDDDPTASIELAVAAAAEFRLVEREARKVAGQIARSVGEWRALAEQMKIGKGEIDRMASAFEHEEAVLARRW